MHTKKRPRMAQEPTIALINIVFLMLIFFMIAGTLAPPLDPQVNLVETAALEGREPPDTLVVYADGTLTLRGTEITSVSAFVDRLVDDATPLSDVRIVPDRDLPAHKLVKIGTDLRALGAEKIFVVSEREIQ
ncbi:biopolymer transporter ExbD [Phaeobacter gallaeciensis]|uniref:Biopolymer transporter ExbD n=3 Tax=Roseobacteraceae TaxID=2854170 RepID=A0A366X9H8_9RHOB|nr:biopolymer transporter ExbD [Falsiruegeria litorea]MBT3142411.1 biopolymer transporter ExbD [Falsiruegeria litorea]MBT8169361.1 biopolymer transporter ExbD [Falsiruegeria litorea]RBW60590.1 biopolymer transporter ExbD [Phaeobacter gallaeciensis]